MAYCYEDKKVLDRHTQEVVVVFEPQDVTLVVGAETFDQVPELGTVVAVNEVTYFVNNDVIDDGVRRHHQFAVEVEVVFAGTAAPDAGNPLQSNTVIRDAEGGGDLINLGVDYFPTVFQIEFEH